MNVSRYYDFLGRQPCLRCGIYGVEIAHIKAFPSRKSAGLMPRSHKGLGAWAAIPLCPDCHRHAPTSIHALGEAAFFATFDKPFCFAFQSLARFIAEFTMEGR